MIKMIQFIFIVILMAGLVHPSYANDEQEMFLDAKKLCVEQEWIEAMKYQLAVRLAPAFGKEQKLVALAPLASSMLENMLDWDNEHADLSVIPDTRFNQ